MFDDSKGPIEHFSWGKYIICGEEHGLVNDEEVGCGRDIRVIGKSISEWTERKGHVLDNTMITGIAENSVEILIIGTGVYEKLECPDEVKNYISLCGVKQIILKDTPHACKEYNKLYNNGVSVALLAHGTC